LDMAATVTDFAPTSQRAVRRPENPAAFADIAKRMTRKARGQTSVAEAVEAVERALNLPADEAFAAERARFLELKSSDQAAALRHIFFAERRTLKDRRAEGTLRPVKSIGVVGGGTMGAGIAAACVMRGFRVTMVERDEDALASGEARVRDAVDGTARRGAIADPAEAMARFEGSVGFDALARADLVIEAVFEDMDVKTSVFRQLDHVTRKDAILATNTSYLDVNEIAGVLDDPSRAIGLHFFSPAHVMKLLEIVLPDAVADDVVATAASLSKRLGKIGVLAGVCDGFIGNRIMSAYRQEADFLLEEGATPDQVDMAMRDFGFPIGIFEMQDLAGLDIAWAMRKRRAASRPSSGRYVAIADRLCEMGRFGRKNGAGWYDYVDGVRKASAVVERVIAEERGARASRTFDAETIMTRILTRLGQEARAVLDEGIARGPDDIDVVMVNGYGFPRWRGGPMFRR
jgi:3-hydroxyacyl-CoA dehydrogenase